ncbi:DcmR-like sensory protein [Natranaerovirga pectinivora]|uniref:DcmR-like sensory protein n=1 Tax=Natranaerovirga pectinivora TaxID=682400 RepID=A0A4R3MQT0_9FIRM|nr:MEDS domain-containing protein [Natranaerovirga pectinivora]TCT14918.1 DcmR-like sensory protein [Natranaerovirga pectinivora]
MSDFIPVTKYLKVSNAAHIAYVFKRKNRYIDNMMAYIKAGIERGHHIIIIENLQIYKQIQEKVKKILSEDDQKKIHYFDNHMFYKCYGDFELQSILKHFEELVQSFLKKRITVRAWAHVEWKEQKNIFSIVEQYEKLSDKNISNMKIMVVCAYNTSEICASLYTGLMRSHEYIMSDTEFVRSSLYMSK